MSGSGAQRRLIDGHHAAKSGPAPERRPSGTRAGSGRGCPGMSPSSAAGVSCGLAGGRGPALHRFGLPELVDPPRQRLHRAPGPPPAIEPHPFAAGFCRGQRG
jgi:hypothetical protein